MPTINSVKMSTGTIQQTQNQNQMDKDLFLKILTTQLRNQDPTQPMEDREMIAQMAQFSQLEQITNLNQVFTQFMSSQQVDLSRYSTMMNKEVSWIDEVNGQIESGVVTGIIKKDNQFFYQVNEEEIPVGNIISAKNMPLQNE
ncbi:flagellar hook capping protein [Neobacillus bataviensis LMG 21833]|uniref:Flagellar hook capping protein n=1 Tax=Neobacillus bataviensis LMG 21833 TaxID=1117379 RepID=K6C0N1_9BACI|nr:flagellar hook capping FlgD N-terminal domain-containing protein [Neobacillus bataviensis]EKN64720.1 flagellar hook capping protein [Neobacillus bataviensis LMG 21833]